MNADRRPPRPTPKPKRAAAGDRGTPRNRGDGAQPLAARVRVGAATETVDADAASPNAASAARGIAVPLPGDAIATPDDPSAPIPQDLNPIRFCSSADTGLSSDEPRTLEMDELRASVLCAAGARFGVEPSASVVSDILGSGKIEQRALVVCLGPGESPRRAASRFGGANARG